MEDTMNEKMRPVETILGIHGGGIKETDGGVYITMIHFIYYKDFCKCHNVPPAKQ
jgi:hypothetical protein